MLEIVNILAADDDASGPITLIIAIAIAAFVALARYLEKRLKSKADQQPKEADKDAAGRRQARPGEQAPRQRLKPVRRASPFESTQAPQTKPFGERETEQLQPELRPVAPAPPRRPVQPAPLPTRTPRQRQQPRARTGEEEIGRLQTHLGKLEQLRARRMEMETPLEADTSAIDARLLRIRPAAIAAAPSGQRLHVDLADLAAARSAIVYHEILSPPKALREGPEMWDL